MRNGCGVPLSGSAGRTGTHSGKYSLLNWYWDYWDFCCEYAPGYFLFVFTRLLYMVNWLKINQAKKEIRREEAVGSSNQLFCQYRLSPGSLFISIFQILFKITSLKEFLPLPLRNLHKLSLPTRFSDFQSFPTLFSFTPTCYHMYKPKYFLHILKVCIT